MIWPKNKNTNRKARIGRISPWIITVALSHPSITIFYTHGTSWTDWFWKSWIFGVMVGLLSLILRPGDIWTPSWKLISPCAHLTNNQRLFHKLTCEVFEFLGVFIHEKYLTCTINSWVFVFCNISIIKRKCSSVRVCCHLSVIAHSFMNLSCCKTLQKQPCAWVF